MEVTDSVVLKAALYKLHYKALNRKLNIYRNELN